MREHLPDFGRIVAVDSSDLTAYSQSRRPSDPDARWAKKRNKYGRDHWWFGYKVHVAACAETELPLQFEVSSASLADSVSLVPLLKNSGLTPQYLLADAGYDAAESYRFIVEDLGAKPIIKLNRRGKKKPSTRIPHRNKTHQRALALRQHAGVPRDSVQWEALYAKRTSVERLFGRMKEFRRLGSVHHRGLAKITLHAYLSTLTVVASAISAMNTSQSLRQVA